ncbi:MAG: DUF2442 domain-containing protein [Bacteroidota bacterium]
MFPKLIDVKGLENFQLSLKYDDGTEGIVDISHLKNKGVFKKWNDGNLFFNVYIDRESNAVAWDNDLDICPDSLYLKLKGLTFEDWKEKQYATN